MGIQNWIDRIARAIQKVSGRGTDRQHYHHRLKAEAAYWADFTVRWVQEGIIPPWGDTRMAINQVIASGHEMRISAAEVENLCRKRQHLAQLLIRIRQLSACGECRVLDLGCGSGFLSLEMARQGAKVTGIDCSSGQLAVAHYFGSDPERWKDFIYPYYIGIELAPLPWHPPDYHLDDFNHWKPEPLSFDVIVAHDALHHAIDLKAIAASMVSALRPGGEIIILEHQEPSAGLAKTHERLSFHLQELVECLDACLDLPPFTPYPRTAHFPAELGYQIMRGLAHDMRRSGIVLPDRVAEVPNEIPPPQPEEESAFEGEDEVDLGSRLLACFSALGMEKLKYEESIDPWNPPLQDCRPSTMSWLAFYARRALAERQVLDEEGLPGDGCLIWMRKPGLSL